MSAPGLVSLQAAIQNDVLTRKKDSLDRIRVPEGTSREKRLGVYQDAYKLRIVGILEQEYPHLFAHMGEKDFWLLADAYINARPSNHPNARTLPNRLPAFIATTEPWSSNVVIAELAALENAIACAFDAQDGPIAQMSDLQQLPPENIGDMTILFTASVRLVPMTTNAGEIYADLANGQSPRDVKQRREPGAILVWRQAYGSKYREPGAEEAMLVNECQRGKNFAQLCEMAAIMDDPETAAGRVAGYLTNWINCEMVGALEVPSD